MTAEYNIPSGLGASGTTGTNYNFLDGGFLRGYPWDSSYVSNYRKAGKELRRELVHLKRPLYTDEFTLSNIMFSAKPFSDANPNNLMTQIGYDLNIQLELYGCSNYDITRRK